jgi:short-chain fatty acids transporter
LYLDDVVDCMLGFARRLGERFSALSYRFIPDPYVIAILLTFVALAAAIGTGATPTAAFSAWGNGLWGLLPFMAAISVLLMMGDAIAKSPTFTRGLERLARVPDSRFQAVWFTGFVAMVTALVSWGVGLIVGAIMAQRVAYECREKGIAVHYPLLVASGYTALMIYHGGLTSSVGLMMADPLLIPGTFPEYARQAIPLSETIGSLASLTATVGILAAVPVVMGLLHPEAEDEIVELPRESYREIDAVVSGGSATVSPDGDEAATDGGRQTERTLADRLNRSRLVGLSIALFPAYFVLDAWVLGGGGISNLSLNSINALFVLLAVLLWVRPIDLVRQMQRSVSNISGIIFQFPFYAGIAGLLTGTGLARGITAFFGEFATPETWPVIGVFVAGLVNVFIPSGGGQWVAVGPVMLDITTSLGLQPADAAVIELLGDQLTNMIQPFWAIPLLAIVDMEARDIIGYTTVAMLVGFLIVGTAVTVFLVPW